MPSNMIREETEAARHTRERERGEGDGEGKGKRGRGKGRGRGRYVAGFGLIRQACCNTGRNRRFLPDISNCPGTCICFARLLLSQSCHSLRMPTRLCYPGLHLSCMWICLALRRKTSSYRCRMCCRRESGYHDTQLHSQLSGTGGCVV